MSLEAIQNMLDATGIRFSYHHWEKPPSLPYGVFLDPTSNNFMADNQVYKSIKHVQIELYAEGKDTGAEDAIETVLNNHELPFEKEFLYIQDERLYETIYEIEV